MISLQTKEHSYAFPLYLYPETTTQKLLETPVRKPNLNPEILQQIAEKLGLTFTPEKSGDGELPAPLNTTNTQGHMLSDPVDNHTFAPIDLLDYIYAVLHSPSYRKTYKEFLKIDFPRVPYPDQQTFWPLVKLGAELRQLHLLESPVLDHTITTYPNDGDNIVTRKINKNDFEITDSRGEFIRPEQIQGRVWINTVNLFSTPS
jgi:predicted helicase